MKRNIFFLLFSFLSFVAMHAQTLSEWRGLGRKGVYSEKGLLQKWPESGPLLLWHNDSLPNGHSSASIAYNTIYLTGIEDSSEVLTALDLNGKFKWKTSFGRAWMNSFPESRCTPTIDGEMAYVVSGKGDVACIHALTGTMVWKRNIFEEYQARYHEWGVAESPIVSGEKLIVSPIGKKTSSVALNKLTGKTIWESESWNDTLAYVSPILVDYETKKIIINVSASTIYAIDASNGKLLWKFKYFDVKTPTWHPFAPIIECVSPVYEDGQVYVTSGYNHAGVMLKMMKDAAGVEMLWCDTVLDTHHGGVVKLGDYIYGSNWVDNGNGNWCCIDWKTGKLRYETKWECKGSIIANEGMLYCYEERRGNLALVKANPEKFEIISSFKIPYGRGPYWSHPVIKDGIMYVRHGTSLMAYDLKQK